MAEAETATEGKTRWQVIKEFHTKPRNFCALDVDDGLMIILQMSGVSLAPQFTRHRVNCGSHDVSSRVYFQVVYMFAPCSSLNTIAFCFLHVCSVPYLTYGFNILIYYSSTLFALAGFSNPIAVGLVVAGTNFIMTFINAMFAYPWGRRKILVSRAWGMSAGLLSIGVAFYWIPVNT